MALVRVLSPQSEPEIAVVKSLLEAHDIPVFVHGRHLGSLLPGLQIGNYNTQSIMVPEECVADALECCPTSNTTSQACFLCRLVGGIGCVSSWKGYCLAGLFLVVGDDKRAGLREDQDP